MTTPTELPPLPEPFHHWRQDLPVRSGPLLSPLYTAEQMHAYAAAAVAAERERCASFLERSVDLSGLDGWAAWQKYTVDLLMGCAAAIRAQKVE